MVVDVDVTAVVVVIVVVVGSTPCIAEVEEWGVLGPPETGVPTANGEPALEICAGLGEDCLDVGLGLGRLDDDPVLLGESPPPPVVLPSFLE